MAKETKNFETEVQQILDMMIHSLYSQKEVFLRELISNASDALDKLRYEEITNKELKTGTDEKAIRLVADKDKKILTISDNGIGMSYDEVVKNIGTIAYSGTKQFLAKAKELKDHPELIGQFGVGFYSAFMVADKITLSTIKAGSSEEVVWESTCNGTYSIERSAALTKTHGTTITLELKKDLGDDEKAQDFLDQWTIKSLVKKYSDFIAYPIKMAWESQEAVKDSEGKPTDNYETKVAEQILNSQKALWLRASKDISDAEYNEFYKHLTNDWTEPLEKIHYKAEGTQEFSALMYLPKNVPFDYNQREMKYGLSLYVKRVFIMADCEKLIPQYLRFLKGIVDSSDLPLNVSREMLQQDRQIEAIKKALVTKVLRSLQTMLEKERDKYEQFWEKFGATLKEGLAMDFANKEKILPLLLYKSTTSEKWSTLAEYVARMPETQKDIFYMTGESIKQLSSSPHLEKLKEKNFEVLYMIDPVDEWVMNNPLEYSDKKFISVTKEDLDLNSEEEKKEIEEKFKKKGEQLKVVTETIKNHLGELVKDVKFSDRLVDSPACLVSGAHDPSSHMEKLMASMGQTLPKSKRIMEINPNHPVFEKMLDFTEEKRKNFAEILYNQALINEGSTIEDPAKFTKQISDLMLGV